MRTNFFWAIQYLKKTVRDVQFAATFWRHSHSLDSLTSQRCLNAPYLRQHAPVPIRAQQDDSYGAQQL